MFDTRIAVVLRNDLATWQSLNVMAFLAGGLVGQDAGLIGEPYIDGADNHYNALIRQPIVVLSADTTTIAKVHKRAIDRKVRCSFYVEEMFKTGHDSANRAVFGQHGPDDAQVVGIALHTDRKTVDKITKGTSMHP